MKISQPWWSAAPLQGVVPKRRSRHCAAPCDSHWFSQWVSSFSHRGHGAGPLRARDERAEGPGPRPGARQGALAAPKRLNRINVFILLGLFAAARALFRTVGCLLAQRPVPRQAAAVSLISHWFFHTNLRWCKVCSGGARRCWRAALGLLAAASVPLDS